VQFIAYPIQTFPADPYISAMFFGAGLTGSNDILLRQKLLERIIREQ